MAPSRAHLPLLALAASTTGDDGNLKQFDRGEREAELNDRTVNAHFRDRVDGWSGAAIVAFAFIFFLGLSYVVVVELILDGA